MTPKQYKEFVHLQALSKSGLNFLNSDEDKMKTVYIEMLNNATSEFRIFAGTLACDVTNSSEFIETLSDYIERGGFLHILLNDYNEETVLESQLFKRLAYYQSQNKSVVVKQSIDHPYINTQDGPTYVHFALGDKKSYRIETDIHKRTAICNMNSPELTAKYAHFFDKLFEKPESTDINLVQLFKL